MTLIEFFMFLITVLVCIYSSVSDLKNGVVLNKVLCLAIVPILIFDVLYYGFLNKEYIVEFAINFFIISIFAILLYATHIWGAGDSKLLIFIALSTPVGIYYHYGNERASLLALLIFVFSIGYLFLLIESIIFKIKKTESFKSEINKNMILEFVKDYIIGGIYLTLFASVMSRMFAEFYYDNQILFSVLNIFIVMLIFDVEIFRKTWALGMSFVADIAIMLSSKQNIFATEPWIYIVIALLFILRQLISQYNYKRIQVEKLKPRMIISAANVIQMSGSKIANMPSGITEDLRSRLTEEEVCAVKKWYNQHKDFEYITIVSKIPFAIFISLGYLFFVLLGLLR